MRKTKVKSTGVMSAEVLLTLKAFLDKVSPDFTSRLHHAEATALKAEADLKFIEDKLVGLLTQEQIEFAATYEMTPVVYALNWLELTQEGKLGRAYAAKIPTYIRNFAELKQGDI